MLEIKGHEIAESHRCSADYFTSVGMATLLGDGGQICVTGPGATSRPAVPVLVIREAPQLLRYGRLLTLLTARWIFMCLRSEDSGVHSLVDVWFATSQNSSKVLRLWKYGAENSYSFLIYVWGMGTQYSCLRKWFLETRIFACCCRGRVQQKSGVRTESIYTYTNRYTFFCIFCVGISII